MTDNAWDFLVDRKDLRNTAFEPSTVHQQFERDGGALLKVDAFALTANNISYAVAGDVIGYWNFFPAREGMGRIPVWGFADVIASTNPALPSGERLYGYLPMSTHVVIQPDRVSRTGLIDGVKHRAPLPPIYNQYTRVAADPTCDPATEAQQALFRPLFTTSFLLDGFLADNDYFGVRTVILTSASSKTSYGLAHLLSRNRSDRCRIVGLTGASNRGFVEGLGCYDQVIGYDEIAKLTVEPVVVVDIAGDNAVTKALDEHFQNNLAYNCAVGATHWEATRLMQQLQGAAPSFFFAPDHAQRLIAKLGPDGFQASLEAAWGTFMTTIGKDIQVVKIRGHEGVADTYAHVLEGNVSAATSYMLSLWP